MMLSGEPWKRGGSFTEMTTMRNLVIAMYILALVALGKDLLGYQAPCQVVSTGAETDALTGSVQNVGRLAIGRASNGLVNMHAGVIPCLTRRPCVSFAPPDFDQDCDVDHGDYALFESCASGPDVPLDPGCEDRDLDSDNDVDHSDFGIFQRCLSGENNPADPDCAD